MKLVLSAILCFGVAGAYAAPAKGVSNVSSVNSFGIKTQLNQDLQRVKPKKKKEKKAKFLVDLRKLYDQPKSSL